MSVIVQIIATGLAAGAVYGALAICVTLVYRLTGVLHLALGPLATLAAFSTLLIAFGRDATAASNASSAAFIGAAALSLAVVAALGALIYVAATEPFLHTDLPLGWLGGIVAAALVLRGLIEGIFTRDIYVLPDPLPFDSIAGGGSIHLVGATVPVRVFFVAFACALLGVASAWFITRARSGRTMRAVIQDPLGAALCGIPRRRVLIGAFAGTALLAGAIGLIVLPGSPMAVDSGTLLGLKAVVAAVAVRFATVGRSLAAGLVLGLVETALSNIDIGPLEIGTSFRDVIPLVVVTILLAVRPAAVDEVHA